MTFRQFPWSASVALEPSPGNCTCELYLGKQFMSCSSFGSCFKRMNCKVYHSVNGGIKDFFPSSLLIFYIFLTKTGNPVIKS